MEPSVIYTIIACSQYGKYTRLEQETSARTPWFIANFYNILMMLFVHILENRACKLFSRSENSFVDMITAKRLDQLEIVLRKSKLRQVFNENKSLLKKWEG